MHTENKSTNAEELLAIIRNNPDPQKALLTATEIIIAYLKENKENAEK